MLEILRYLKDPELCELWYTLIMGNAGFYQTLNPKPLSLKPINRRAYGC